MPRKNNKKKNKGKAGFGRERKGKNANTTNLGSNNKNSNTATLRGTATTRWEELKNRKQALAEDYTTVYTRYKNATKRFLDYMTKTCPLEEMKERNTNSLLMAADWMAESGHVVDKEVLRDLKLAIRMRNRVAESVYDGGDKGHRYFLEVLTYCWCVLNSLPKTAKEKLGESSNEQEEQKSSNPFEALAEDDDEEENDEEMFPSNPVLRPSSPSESEPMSLDDLLESDDRRDAIIFLMTIDEIMGAIVKQYKTTVVKNVHLYKKIGCPPTAIVEEMIEAAVAANMAIQQVQRLEMDLITQHGHLSTPYRLFATLVYPQYTRETMLTVRNHAAKKGCTEKDVSVFLGDCLECCFRNKQDPKNKRDIIVQEFCRKWQIDSAGSTQLEMYPVALQELVTNEIPVGPEKLQVARIRNQYMSGDVQLPPSGSWIPDMPFIGGDRSIHHIMRLLQTFGGVIHDTPHDRGIAAKRGFFGKSPWVPGRSHTIGDLDELLLADILPNWVLMCRKGILGFTKLPMEDELCPLFVVLRNYVEDPLKPVSWSTAFAIHAMMTAVLEVGPVFNSLLSTSKSVFAAYFSQLEWARMLADKNPESIGDKNSSAGEMWWRNMGVVEFLENLGRPIFGDRTLWNPLCAGTTLSYLAYFGNIEGGTALIDCHAQLRITLHLFHALVVNGIIRRGQIPFLDIIFDAFQTSKAVWGGQSLPQRGEFVHRFWICFGANVADTRRLVGEAKEIFQGGRHVTRPTSAPRSNRKLNHPVEPAEISKSYRRICNRDFRGVVDKYHTPEQRRRCKGSDQYLLMVRINDTLDAIDDEQKLLSLNLPNCSVLLEQFVNSLGRILLWENLLVHGATVTGHDQRQGFAYLFAQYLLAALDFAEDPFACEFLEVPLGQASSNFMSTFFNRLNPEKARWFMATQEED